MAEPEEVKSPPAKDIEAEVLRTIAACDGDPVAAVRALIILNTYLDSEVERLTALVSRGYARGGGRATGRKA
jgi:hypothetical protein